MNTLIAYLLIACLGSVLFVGLDLLVLKPFASHRQRRQVLLFAILTISLMPIAGIFLPLKLPKIQFVYQGETDKVTKGTNEEVVQWLPTLMIGEAQAEDEALSLSKAVVFGLVALWALLCSLYFSRMLKRLKALRTLHRKSQCIAHYEGCEVRQLLDEERNAFSFLGRIYLSKDVCTSPQKGYILKHEVAHIKLGHSYDMLLSELLLLPQCFNPFASYLTQALKEVHEYQADELVLSDKSVPRKAYQYTLLCFAMQGDYDPVCQFFRIPYLYNNQLKNRIIMMKKERKASSKWSYVFALPIMALMLWGGNSCAQEQSEQSQAEQSQAEQTSSQTKRTNEATKAIIPAVVEIEGYDICTSPSATDKVTEETLKESGLDPNEVEFKTPDASPTFKGGGKALMDFLRHYIEYPQEAIDKNIEGRVVVSFVIEEDGSISNPKIFRGKHPLLDKAALHVVDMMPNWIPAKKDGKAIRQKFYLPVLFRLQD